MDRELHRPRALLDAGLERIRGAPADAGRVDCIVRRPRDLEREVLDEGHFDVAEGLVGDNWKTRFSRFTDDGSAHPDMQLNVMSSRAIELIANDAARWSLAGDQLFLDLDLSVANLPAGARLAVGEAVIEVTEQPHLGCKKFVERFGLDAMQFVNSEIGKTLRLRGLNAKVVQSGVVRCGDLARKL